MNRAFLFSIVVACLLYFFVIGSILYVEGAPIGVEGIIEGGIVYDSNGNLVVIPDQKIPDSAIHMAWTPEYIFEQQFRHNVDTFTSTMYPFLVFIGTGAGALVAVYKALPVIKRIANTA